MWYPSNHDGKTLEYIWINRYSQGATAIIYWTNSPRHERLAATAPANLEIVSRSFDSTTELAFVNPAAEIVNFIIRIRTWPHMHWIARAEWMADFEVSGQGDRVPYRLRRCRDGLLDRDRPFESGNRFVSGHTCDSFGRNQTGINACPW